MSILWGRYADKTSFANMLEKCSIILGLGVICATLATPGNGKIMFSLYYGLSIFGFKIYAQQAVSAISLLFIVIMILYTKFVIKKLD